MVHLLPRTVRAVICDLDGTLIDTETAYCAAFQRALDQFGATLPPGAYECLVGLSTPARRKLLPDLMGDCFPIDAFFTAYYRHRDSTCAERKPGVEALLAELDRLALPRAIVTSASSVTAHRHLDRLGLGRRFDVVVTRDHVAQAKPAPDSFRRAADLLDVAAEDCLAIEDSAPGIHAAGTCGMMVAVVPDMVAPTQEVRRICVAVLPSLFDAIPLLTRSAMKPICVDVRSRWRV